VEEKKNNSVDVDRESGYRPSATRGPPKIQKTNNFIEVMYKNASVGDQLPQFIPKIDRKTRVHTHTHTDTHTHNFTSVGDETYR
jgi:hypothetical protein